MKAYHFKALLQNNTWLSPAYVQLDEVGKIISIDKEKNEDITYEAVNGYALPGMQNAHSHAFQYAMAGINERHDLSKTPDDFWSWRNAMYQIALNIDPQQMEDIATMLYAEMLRHGYTSVAEFHYLHHDQKGNSYQNLAEMGERLIAAAQKASIKITLVPIFYQKGGFGEAAETHQRRFISSDIDAYLKLFEASKEVIQAYDFASIAYGVHSLRAVEPIVIQKLTEIIHLNSSFHIHISEQKKEVEDALKYLGKRPVEWLIENINLNENYHLVHATHLTQSETVELAKSNAHVVLCPSTEANLGDGIFNLKDFQKNGGRWSIGTDSHIGLNPFEELRILDYGQRLTSYKRNSFYADNQGDSGLYAFNQSIISGRRAMGNSTTTFFEKEQYFDAVVFDATTPLLAATTLKNLASTILYASDVSMQYGTIVNGKWVVQAGKHQNNEHITHHFVKAIKNLNIR